MDFVNVFGSMSETYSFKSYHKTGGCQISWDTGTKLPTGGGKTIFQIAIQTYLLADRMHCCQRCYYLWYLTMS